MYKLPDNWGTHSLPNGWGAHTGDKATISTREERVQHSEVADSSECFKQTTPKVGNEQTNELVSDKKEIQAEINNTSPDTIDIVRIDTNFTKSNDSAFKSQVRHSEIESEKTDSIIVSAKNATKRRKNKIVVIFTSIILPTLLVISVAAFVILKKDNKTKKPLKPTNEVTTSSETETAQTDIKIDTEFFSIVLPRNWENKYVQESEINLQDGKTFVFSEKISGVFIFSIDVSMLENINTLADFDFSYGDNALGVLSDKQTADDYSVVQYGVTGAGADATSTYIEMLNDVDTIIKSFKPNNNFDYTAYEDINFTHDTVESNYSDSDNYEPSNTVNSVEQTQDYTLNTHLLEDEPSCSELLENYTKDDIQELINTMLAMHHYKFQEQKWIDFFRAYEWYYYDTDSSSVAESRFNEIEKANYRFLIDYRNKVN